MSIASSLGTSGIMTIREVADYPTETFRGLKSNEIRQFGEYRTRRLVLEAWDRLTLASQA